MPFQERSESRQLTRQLIGRVAGGLHPIEHADIEQHLPEQPTQRRRRRCAEAG